MPVLKGGLIGLRGHAERLLKLFEARENVEINKIYLPRKDDDFRVTQNLDDLFDLDFIILSSPTPSHSEQLIRLCDYEGHIFCEKPIALDSNILKKLRGSLFENRFYTNYCFHCSPVGLKLAQFFQENIDDILDVHINISHGVAWRLSPENWRFHSQGGVLNTVASHFLHYFFNLSDLFEMSISSQMSITGKGVDYVKLKITDGKMDGRVVTSWALPEIVDIKVISKDGVFSWDGNFMINRRVNKDVSSNEIVCKDELSSRENFMQSLSNSIDLFLAGVTNGVQNSMLHQASLETEEYLMKSVLK